MFNLDTGIFTEYITNSSEFAENFSTDVLFLTWLPLSDISHRFKKLAFLKQVIDSQ